MTETVQLALGRRRLPKPSRVAPELIAALGQVDVSDLSDVMSQVHSLSPAIRMVSDSMPAFAGSALTVVAPYGAKEPRVAAMEMAGPGDVLVMVVYGAVEFAVLGEMQTNRLLSQGVTAVVVDGNIRDRHEISKLPIPVMCRGSAIASGPKTGSGEINVPVACGGVVINPGDVIVGNANGAVSIPAEFAADVLRAAQSHVSF